LQYKKIITKIRVLNAQGTTVINTFSKYFFSIFNNLLNTENNKKNYLNKKKIQGM